MTLLDFALGYLVVCVLAVGLYRAVCWLNEVVHPELPQPPRTLDMTGWRK